MRFHPILVAAALGTALTGPAGAQSADALLKSKGCLRCHAVATEKIGPAFKDIAAKHAADPKAADKLAADFKATKDHAKVTASDAELKTMLTQVLATK